MRRHLRKRIIPPPTPNTTRHRHYSTLNYDVWLYISSFLTLQELWNARFLNEVVYGIAMDAGYQVVHVPTDYRLFKGFSHWFSRFYYGADVAHRVRTIHFSPLADVLRSSWGHGRRVRIKDHTLPQDRVLSFYKKFLQQLVATTIPTIPNTPTTPNRPLSKLNRIKRRLQGIFLAKSPNPRPVPKQTIATIPKPKSEEPILSLAHFSVVSNIIVDLYEWKSEEEILLPLSMIKASASNLNSLSLNVPLNLVLRFLSDATLFPYLEKLSIEKQFFESYNAPYRWPTPTSVDMRIQPLATFINRHSDTLLSFALRLPIQVLEFEPGPYPVTSNPSAPFLSSIFNNFNRIPKLVSLSLYLSRETDPKGLRQFLRQQTETLRKLEIALEKNLSYIGADQVLAAVRDSLENCCLSSLSIRYLIDNKEWQRTRDQPNSRIANALGFIRNIVTHCNLTSLEIVGYFNNLLPDELRKILGMRGSIRCLRHLALRIRALTVDIIDLIVSELPALQSLDLTVCAFTSRYSPYLHREEDFALEMQERTYADWGLQSLKLVDAVDSLLPSVYFTIAARGIVHALPNVHIFNGLSRSEYLSQLIDEESCMMRGPNF